MNGHIGPLDFTAMGREYLAHADTIGGKVAQLRREYRESHDRMLKEQIENWKEIEETIKPPLRQCRGGGFMRWEGFNPGG